MVTDDITRGAGSILPPEAFCVRLRSAVPVRRHHWYERIPTGRFMPQRMAGACPRRPQNIHRTKKAGDSQRPTILRL